MSKGNSCPTFVMEWHFFGTNLVLFVTLCIWYCYGRDHFVYVPSQWEMALHCNAISHWVGAYTEWFLLWWSCNLHGINYNLLFPAPQYEVIKCLKFSFPWEGESTSHWWIPLPKAGNAELWCFLAFCLNKLLNKQSSCQWFEMPWCSCDITVMCTHF